MSGESFIVRIAPALRLPVLAVGLLGAGLVASTLRGWSPDILAFAAAMILAAPGVVLFLAGVLDPRFQRAVAALNAARREQAERLGGMARAFGWGLPVGDRLLFAVSLALIAEVVWANYSRHAAAAALGFATFWLVCLVQIALMVRYGPRSTD